MEGGRLKGGRLIEVLLYFYMITMITGCNDKSLKSGSLIIPATDCTEYLFLQELQAVLIQFGFGTDSFSCHGYTL